MAADYAALETRSPPPAIDENWMIQPVARKPTL
jgi:hypothetical protein